MSECCVIGGDGPFQVTFLYLFNTHWIEKVGFYYNDIFTGSSRPSDEGRGKAIEMNHSKIERHFIKQSSLSDVARRLSDVCQTFVRRLSDVCQKSVRSLSDICQKFVRSSASPSWWNICS